jgi:hypothetical protein
LLDFTVDGRKEGSDEPSGQEFRWDIGYKTRVKIGVVRKGITHGRKNFGNVVIK